MNSSSNFDNGLRHGRDIARWVPFVIVALIGAIAAVVAFRIAADADDTRVHGAMELRAEWRARDLERKLGTLADPVEAMAILLASDREPGSVSPLRRWISHGISSSAPSRLGSARGGARHRIRHRGGFRHRPARRRQWRRFLSRGARA